VSCKFPHEGGKSEGDAAQGGVHGERNSLWYMPPQGNNQRVLHRYERYYDLYPWETQIAGQVHENVDSDIKKFNQYVKSQLDSLNARGQTTQDLLANLFKGYDEASDSTFRAYVAKKQDEYHDGVEIEPNHLMQLALYKYQTLLEGGKWNAPTKADEKIIALEAQLKKLGSKGTAKNPGRSGTMSYESFWLGWLTFKLLYTSTKPNKFYEPSWPIVSWLALEAIAEIRNAFLLLLKRKSAASEFALSESASLLETKRKSASKRISALQQKSASKRKSKSASKRKFASKWNAL
jgi:hypothetical protein